MMIEYAQKVVAWYKRRSYRTDCWEDALQEAIVAMLLASRKTQVENQLKAAASYAVRRYLYQSSSPVSYQHRPERLAGITANALDTEIPSNENVEAAILDADWCAKAAEGIARVLGTDAAIAGPVLLERRPVQEVAEAAGLPPERVHAVVVKARRHLREDRHLATLMESAT